MIIYPHKTYKAIIYEYGHCNVYDGTRGVIIVDNLTYYHYHHGSNMWIFRGSTGEKYIDNKNIEYFEIKEME